MARQRMDEPVYAVAFWGMPILDDLTDHDEQHAGPDQQQEKCKGIFDAGESLQQGKQGIF